MKILFIHSGADLYGASRSCLRLSSRLKADGNEVLVVLSFDGPLRAALAENGVDVRVFEGMSLLSRHEFKSAAGLLNLPFRLIRATVHVFRLIGTFNPDIVHSNTGTVFLCGGLAAWLRGAPHVQHVREDFGDFAMVWKMYQWLLWALAARILCVSEFATRQFRPERIRRIVRRLHNGFPRSEFLPQPGADIEKFRRRFRLDGHKLVGLLGRINTFRKGQLTFVEAAKLVHAEMPDARFLLVGSPFPGNEDHLVAVQKRISDLGLGDVVILTGDVENVKAVYQALDVVVQGSVMPEGFSGVVIEAMAYGVPVVGTRLGGTVEQIADGETGLLVEPGNATEMAAALLRLLGDDALRRDMGRRGRERFDRCFEFEAFYSGIIAIYTELAR